MKRKGSFMYGWLAAVAMAFVIPMVASAALVITEVNPGVVAGTPSTINGDWWELTNTGPLPVDLAGYQWADTEDDLNGATPSPNIFPSFVIGAGQSIIILDEAASNEGAWLTNWGLSSNPVAILSGGEMTDDADMDGDTFSGLGGSNDAVYFYSPLDELLSSYTYGVATNGTSFEGDTHGGNHRLSVVGEHGAYQEQNYGNIGSPGIAVPEPMTIFMTLCGVAVAVCFRRVR
jgi:hypothetical protein